MKNIFHIFTLLLLAGTAFAQEPAETDEDRFFLLERNSLEQVLNLKTSVASKAPIELRKTPGIVTVFTEEDIRLSGSRNLLDLLRRVPDFEFVSDVQGNIGLGVRGNSTIEGKVRVIWDGQTYNGLLYGTVQLDRFPIDQIERVEIIKGPGSVIYGGLGEMAIINIVTKTSDNMQGSRIYAGYGQMRSSWGRRFGGYQFASARGDFGFSALAHFSTAQRSDRTYRDFSGGSYSMNGDSDLESKNLNISLRKRGFSLRLIADDYSLLQRDLWGDMISTGPARIKFPVYSAEVAHSFQAAENLRISPFFSFQYSKPWNEADDHFPYDKTVRVLTGGLTAFYDTRSGISLLGGAEFKHDDIEVGGRTSPDSSYYGTRDGAQYDNMAVFLQTNLDLPLFMLTAGARMDSHSHNGTDFSPRVAITRRIEDFHFKAIYSGGFRSPTAENIRLTPSIRPEHTTALEFEAGYMVNENLFVSADAFDITIRDTILYYSGPIEDYVNSGKTGTRGGGLQVMYSNGGHRLELGYTNYSAAKSHIAYTEPPQSKSAMLALPRHKAVLTSRHALSEKLTLSPSLIYLSKRYGYHTASDVKPYDELLLAGAYLHARDVFTRGLELGIGVHDIFGANYSYIQSYNGGHAPLPAESREFFLKAAYAF